jgi:hypothetical protein
MTSVGHTRTAVAIGIEWTPERARLLACSGDDAAAGRLPIGGYRLPAQLRIVELVRHGRVERVHVDMNDSPRSEPLSR